MRGRSPGEPLRIVLLGSSVNSPHFEPLALEMVQRGHQVRLAGYLAPDMPPSRLDGLGIPFFEMPQPFGRGVIDAIRSLRRLLREFESDVVHAHYLSRYTFPAVAARTAPAVFTAWGSDVLLPKPRRELLFDRATLRLSRAFTADSQAVVDRLCELGVSRRRIELIRWGVDGEIFRPPVAGERERVRAELGLGEGPVLLSPRAFKPLYNLELIVEAFERIAGDYPTAELVVKHLGSEPIDFGELRHKDRIHVVGAIPYERMGDFYRAADICVSIPSSDSSPRSVWEAMACGCACVLSELPWVSELIEPDRDAAVVSIEVGSLESALRQLLDDPALQSSFIERGRALVAQHHDMNKEMDLLESLYRRVANRT